MKDLAHYEDLALRLHGLLDALTTYAQRETLRARLAADKRRVDRDLAGLRTHQRNGVLADECARCYQASDPCDDARRYAEDLDDLATLYPLSTAPRCDACGKWHDATLACPGRPVGP